MSAELQKQEVAEAALQYIDEHRIIGVGTGSTVNYFIDALATMKAQIEATVSSSEASKLPIPSDSASLASSSCSSHSGMWPLHSDSTTVITRPTVS